MLWELGFPPTLLVGLQKVPPLHRKLHLTKPATQCAFTTNMALSACYASMVTTCFMPQNSLSTNFWGPSAVPGSQFALPGTNTHSKVKLCCVAFDGLMCTKVVMLMKVDDLLGILPFRPPFSYGQLSNLFLCLTAS